jgi:signal transduction histidine kinase
LRLLWVIVGVALGEPMHAAAGVLESTAAIRAVSEWNLREPHPLRVEGTLTWIDRERRLLVLQDSSGAVALRGELAHPSVTIGRRIAVETTDSWPVLPSVPDFPVRPAGSERLAAFESASKGQTNYLARVRGYVHPPTTGTYRFWIASDDSSELWLGTHEDPKTARPIAAVSRWTKAREWTHLPEQQSAEILLEAGRRYYIEAVHEQRWLGEHLSVSWAGPSVPQQIIAGEHLSAWLPTLPGDAPGDSPARGYVLREYWTERLIDNVAGVTAPRKFEATLETAGMAVRDLGPASPPLAQRNEPGEAMPPGDGFRWTELEGLVDFVARRGHTLVLDLSAGSRRTRAIVQRWEGEPPPRLSGRRVRLQGVAEPGLNEAGEQVLSTLRVPPTTTIPVLEASPRIADARLTTIADLLASDPMQRRNQLVKFRSRIARNDHGRITVGDAGAFYGSVSQDGSTWKDIGGPVEIPMGETVQIGLMVTSRSTENVATAVFENLQGFPDALKETAIGGPTRPGELRRDDGRLTLRGSGHDIWFGPDQFHFAHAPLTGAGEIVVRIAAFDAFDPWAKAGVMIRESLAPDSQFVDLVQTGANGCSFQWRRAAEGSAPHSVTDPTLKAPHWLKLARRFNSISVAGEHLGSLEPGTLVEITGYVTLENGGLLIADASCREFVDDGHQPSRQARPLVELASVIGAAGNPGGYDLFKVRGVLTFYGEVAGRRYVSVQDRSGAIFVIGNTARRVPPLRAGQFVEIHRDTGTAVSPHLNAANVFVLGEGTFPAPLAHPLEYSLPRRGEGSWVEVEGIVRTVAASGVGQIKTKGELISFAVAGAAVESLRRHVDGRVRLRGSIAFPSEGERLLLVPSSEHLEVVEAAPEQPFAIAVQPIDQLALAKPLNETSHRMKVQGAVTFVGRGFLFVQDAPGGARIETSDTNVAQVGDLVEATGFPELAADLSLVLAHALVRRTGGTTTTPAAAATLDDLLAGRWRGQLLRLEAVVSRVRATESDATLELQLDQRVLRATLSGSHAPLPAIPPGSRVAVTGVSVREGGVPDWMHGAANPGALLPSQLLLRGPADLVVLQKPRWWVVKRTLLGTSVAVFVLIVSWIWIHILRRRVAQRTAELHATMEKLRRETQTAATLAERNRLAGEIHDSLEQGFSGLILHLDTTAKKTQCPPDVRAGLALARNMVAFSRNEVRHAVWDLQSPILDNSDLGTALKNIIEQLAPETPHTTLTVRHAPRPLGSAVEHHLLRIAQEAVTNCVKHAEARSLEMILDYAEAEVVLTICDDGRGFVPGQVLNGGVGHFGLRSLRGRASKIHGTIAIVSAPGEGTRVEVRVPTPNAASV